MPHYNVKYKDKSIQGNLRPRNNTLEAPRVSFTKSQTDFSTLLIWDPDAPAKSWIHWFVVNIPGTAIQSGQELLNYEPPNPPSGIHRYFVTLYTQPGRINVSAPEYRGNFDVSAFEQTYGLTKFGEKMVKVSA